MPRTGSRERVGPRLEAENVKEEGGNSLSASAYHAVLAVKDERGARSPPAAVFDP